MQLEDFDTKNEKSLSSDDNLIPWITLCLENDFGNFELSCGKHEFQFDVKSVWNLNGLFDAFAEKFQFRVFSRNWDALFDKKFISFDPETGKMIKAARIDDETLRKFGVPDNWRESVSIPVNTDRRREYLRWHNKLMEKEDAKHRLEKD